MHATAQHCFASTLAFALAGCSSNAETTPRVEPQPAAFEGTPVDVPIASATAPAPSASERVTPAPLPTPVEETDRPNADAAHWLASEDAAFGPVAIAVDAKKYADARRALAPVVAKLSKERREVFLVARSLEGELARATHDVKAATAANTAVLADISDNDALVAAVLAEPVAIGDADTVHHTRLQRALDAMGEALYFEAEDARKKADGKHAPALTGPATKEAVLKFVTTSIKPWIEERRALMDEAEKRFVKVTQVRPSPPPRWVVASAAHVGGMWGSFVDEFRGVPMPSDWKRQPDVADLYRASLESASEPLMNRARAAYRTCADMADRFNVADADAASCRAWLDAHPQAKP